MEEGRDFFLVKGRKEGKKVKKKLGGMVEEGRNCFLVKRRKEGRKVKEEGS